MLARLRLILSAVALSGLLVGLSSRIPLAWALGDTVRAFDSNARAIGSVWDGAIIGVDGLPPIRTKLAGTRLALAANDPTLRLSGMVSTRELYDVNIVTPVTALARFDPRLSGLSGNVAITIDALAFAGGRCTSATGTAQTDVLAANAARWSWQGPELSGPVSCEDGELILALQGEATDQTASARLRLDPAGPYRSEIGLSTREPAAGLVLPMFGFEPDGADRWRLSESGRWQ